MFTGRSDGAEAPILGHLIQRANSLKNTPMLGNIKDRRRRGQQRMRWLHGITNPMDKSLNKLQKIIRGREPGLLQVMGPQRVGHDLAPERQQGCMSSISLWFWFACFQRLTVLVIFSDGLLVHHNSSNKCQYWSSAYYVSGTVLSSEEIGEQWKKGTWILHFSGEKEIINMLHVMIKIWKRKWRVMWKLRQAGVTRQGNQGRPV